MKHLESAGHRGHGTERTLDQAMGTGACSGTHETRVRQLSDGAMTGGKQPTNIRGIDRRGKVPGGPLAPGASFQRRAGPHSGTPRSLDRSIHISPNSVSDCNRPRALSACPEIPGVPRRAPENTDFVRAFAVFSGYAGAQNATVVMRQQRSELRRKKIVLRASKLLDDSRHSS